MKWYKKYLSIYEKSYQEISPQIKEEIRQKIERHKNPAPLVSVVAIAHNEEKHILSCLWSLCDNITSFPIEILVINNNSTDNTVEILSQLKVTWLDEKKKGPGFARQCGLEHAKGKYHLCIDADTIYPPYYIQTLVNQLMVKNTVGVFSLWSFIPDKKHPKTGLIFYEFLRDIHLKIQYIKRPELCVRGMTFGFKTKLAKKYGFRTDIKRGEDGSLALLLKKEGNIKFISSRKARVYTSNSTLNLEGSLLKNLKIRILKALNLKKLVTKQEVYKDDISNLIK